VSRAPSKVVDEARARRQALEVQLQKLQHTLREMGA
jgi:hypothetical protein